MDDRYEEHKQRAAERQAEISRLGREIGPLPSVANPERRDRGGESLRLFLETYFAEAFPFAWSPDHLQVIELIEAAVHNGNTQAIAMPRGSGKTTICTRAVLWAILYGYHNYVILIAADEGKASKLLKAIKSILMNNPLLVEDFPEACYPIMKLQRQVSRANGQTCDGKPTDMEFLKEQIVLPTIPNSVCSGAVIQTGGIEAAVRGAQYTRSTGEVMRPTLALVDDPQTRRTAGSEQLNYEREMVVTADLLNMAGPGNSLSVLMTCTVIYPNDMADKLLTRKLHAEWHGIRCKMLYEMPKNMELWDQYWDVRQSELLVDHPKGTKPEVIHAGSTKFYKSKRKAMDKGAVVAWEERKQPHELSALQHAMNLYYKNPEGFEAEFQNTPQSQETQPEENYLSAMEIAKKKVVTVVALCRRRLKKWWPLSTSSRDSSTTL